MDIDQHTLLNGRYRLTEHIGVGGTADVWRATDVLLSREVAVKLLRQVADPLPRTRFIEEAQTLASFNHPGLVVVLDAGILGAQPFLVMTLADGGTLASRIAAGSIESDTVRSIGTQIALALAYVHDRGVVHRDVKPSNVLLCGDGRAVLSDFGIARLIGAPSHHTRTGDAIGSPAYLSPEQVAGEDIAPAVDIYSLGLTLLESLTAERAFPGPPIEAAIARLSAAPRIPATVGGEWDVLLRRMTHRIPEQRPTAQQVAEHLEGFEVPLPITTGVIQVADRDPEATSELSVISADPTNTMAMESVLTFDDAADFDTEHRVEPADRRRRWPALAVAFAILALAVTVLVTVRSADAGSKTPTATTLTSVPAAPKNVPAKYRPALSRLHDAVKGSAR